jgi:exonuclease VII small subunit
MIWLTPVTQHSVLSFDLAKAREAVRKAKRVLQEAEEQFDSDHSMASNLPMMRRIHGAERHLEQARTRLRQIDPTSTE